MDRRLQYRIRYASQRRFYAAAALLGAYSIFLFGLPSPFTRARIAADDRLPELIAGFPDKEPAAALARLGAARADYLWSQAFDLPFILLLTIAAMSAMAIALKRLGLHRGDAQYALLLPALYLLFEVIENALLALFASGVAPVSPALTLLQQTATTAKLGALVLTILFGLAAILAWALSALDGAKRRA